MTIKHLLFICSLLFGSMLFAQYEQGIGFNVNGGLSWRLNASLCFEKRIEGNLMFRANVGLGNFLPFNVQSPSDRMLMPTRFDNNKENFNQHIDLTYAGFRMQSSNSKIFAPEFKLGVLYMTGGFRQKNKALSGLYLGYQAGFAFITQTYTNSYIHDPARTEEVSGTAVMYSMSPINILVGFKKLIGQKTTFDIGLEQSIGFIFDRNFKSQKEFYYHPYSGLKCDLSVGIRRVF